MRVVFRIKKKNSQSVGTWGWGSKVKSTFQNNWKIHHAMEKYFLTKSIKHLYYFDVIKKRINRYFIFSPNIYNIEIIRFKNILALDTL